MSQTDSPLGTAPVGKLVLQLAIPAMLAQFVNILYSVVDRMYVGHIAGAGDAALAGVGVCAPVVTMITAIGALIGFGGGPLMSIRMGRRDMDGARQIITNSFYLLLALSVLATVPLLIFKRQILFTFGCSELLWDYAQAYFTTYVSGTVFALLSYGLNQITMSQGFSGTAMRSVMLGAAVNIALDPVFIFALHMGVRGAALATVLSQACSTVYILRFLMSDRAAVRIPVSRSISAGCAVSCRSVCRLRSSSRLITCCSSPSTSCCANTAAQTAICSSRVLPSCRASCLSSPCRSAE
ncbi:MAG: MATE family efflux transporter [Butyricicoccus sp.]